jgi:DNA gyrase subunit A
MDASERNGAVVNLILVTSDVQIMAGTDKGQLIRTKVAEIRQAGRNTQGVRVMRMADDERVVDVGVIAEREEEGTGMTNPPPSMPPDSSEPPEGGAEA